MGPRDIDVLDFGADLTGTFDSTTPIQNAIDYLVSVGGGTLYFPTGNYKITQTLIYNGNDGNSIHFKGALGNAITGAQLIWYGENRGGPMMTCTTLTYDTFSHLNFLGTLDGLHGPQYIFWVRETPNPVGGGSSEDTYFDRCLFGGAVGPGSACFVIGDGALAPGGGDIAELRFNACTFSSSRYGTGGSAVAVIDATNTSPIVVRTTTPHGLVTGQSVVISGVTGNTAANVGAFVTVIDPTHFSLDGTTGNGAYSGGGTVNGSSMATCENGVLVKGGGNNKNYSFTNCCWRNFLKAGVKVRDNSGSLTFLHPVMGFNQGVAGLIADFHIMVALQNLTIIGAETEGSARALYGYATQNYGSANLNGYNWNGFSIDNSGDPDSTHARLDTAIYWGGALLMLGCYFNNMRTPSAVPQICVGADPGVIGVGDGVFSTSITSLGNYFYNASFLPFYDDGGGNLLVEWQDYAKGGNVGPADCPILSRGDMGGPAGKLIRFPSYEGSNVRVGPQQLLVEHSALVLNSGTPAPFTKVNSGVLATSIGKFSVDYIDFQTGAATKTILLAQMPARTRMLGIIANTTIPYAWANMGEDSILLSVGGANSATEFLLGHDVKTAATRKGEHTADLGADLAIAAQNAFGFISSWTTVLPINAVIISGKLGGGAGQNLSGLNAGHTDFYVAFQVLP